MDDVAPIFEPADQDIQATSQRLASLFVTETEPLLNSALTVRACQVERQHLVEFLATVEEPSCCYLLVPSDADSAQELSATAIVAFSPQIAYPMIDHLLGGSDADAFLPGRALTTVERRLLRRFATQAAKALQFVWPSSPKPTLQLAEGAFVCDDLPSFPAEQEVATLTVALSLGRHVGAMRLCVSEWAAQLDSAAQPAPRKTEGPLELAVSLQAEIDPAELADLTPGDIVMTDATADSEVVVRIAGIPKFAAHLCASDGKRAVTITRKLHDMDDTPHT